MNSIWSALRRFFKAQVPLGMTDGEKFEVRKHDIQEFNSMVGRWGAYHSLLKEFVKLATPQLSLELMNGGKAKKASGG